MPGCANCGSSWREQATRPARTLSGRANANRDRAGARRVSAAEKYVAAAYLVVFVAVLAWVAIIAAKLVRLERDVEELAELARRRAEREPEREEVSV
jgi:hypothetical protein